MSPNPFEENRVKAFLTFVFLSGAGWLCDFFTFTVLVTLLGWSSLAANFASSYAGVTFVWVTSLHVLFGGGRLSRGRYLLIFWGYQFVSIIVYSLVVQLGETWMVALSSVPLLVTHAAIVTKMVVTPLNLATNFMFMKFLTGFMSSSIK